LRELFFVLGGERLNQLDQDAAIRFHFFDPFG
jgi:hypothetical protein